MVPWHRLFGLALHDLFSGTGWVGEPMARIYRIMASQYPPYHQLIKPDSGVQPARIPGS